MILAAEFEDDDGYRDFRPRMPKRQRVPPVVQLCREMMPDIRTLGESKKAFEEDIQFLSDAIANEYGHEEYFNDALLSTLRAVVVEQPHKQAGIALLALAVNAKNQVAGKSIVNFFHEELQRWCREGTNAEFEAAANETGPWNKVKLVLRFLSLLAPMLAAGELMDVYDRLGALAVALSSGAQAGAAGRCSLAEELYVGILVDIPHLFFFERSDAELRARTEALLDRLEQEYRVQPADVGLLRTHEQGAAPYEQTALAALALSNVRRALGNEMEELSRLFPDWAHLVPEQPGRHGFNEELQLPSAEQAAPFAGLDRGFGSVDGMWKTPRYDFRVYFASAAADFATVVPAATYTGQLLRDVVVDVVEGMEFNRKEVARQVMTLDLHFREGIFAEPGISMAQLAAVFEEDPLAATYKLEDLVVETVLGLLFTLPTVSQPFAYFYTLLVEICQNSPKAIAPVFGRAFRFLYAHLEGMDAEVRMRFLDWFCMQMSNFNFSWKWNEWEEDEARFGGCFYHPRVSFARDIVRKELRLTSNVMDVEDSLPGAFRRHLDTSYVPETAVVAYYQSLFAGLTVDAADVKRHDLYFRQAGVPFAAAAQKVLDYMHKQGDSKQLPELEDVLDELEQEHGGLFRDFGRFKIVLLGQALAHSGSRSLSHANKYIEDLRGDLKQVLDGIALDQETKEYVLVEAVLMFWNANSQTGYLVADALKFAGLVSARTIIRFALAEHEGGRIYGLQEATAVEAIFRNLSEEALAGEMRAESFEAVFERLCGIATESVAQLGLSAREPVGAPGAAGAADEALERADVRWKYLAAMSLIKSVLRKYSDEYRLLADKFREGMDGAVAHEETKRQLLGWLEDLAAL